MNNQLKSRQLSMGLMLFTVLMLGSCGKKPEESASTTPTPQTPTAISQANPGSIKQASPSPTPVNTTTPSSNKSISGANKTAVLAAAQKLGVKPQSETNCPSDALVKGKITNKRGNIYHISKSLDYEKIKPDICFKDPATAQQAGFRAPK
ncbi:sunset domain-containing protein [Nostoc sp.]|uniref:sunset domain-containing protein n=1 Tax=Nostoc sp. TaxID=1180 RepID=UPI002FF7E89A